MIICFFDLSKTNGRGFFPPVRLDSVTTTIHTQVPVNSHLFSTQRVLGSALHLSQPSGWTGPFFGCALSVFPLIPLCILPLFYPVQGSPPFPPVPVPPLAFFSPLRSCVLVPLMVPWALLGYPSHLCRHLCCHRLKSGHPSKLRGLCALSGMYEVMCAHNSSLATSIPMFASKQY